MKRKTLFAYVVVIILVATLVLSSAFLAFESDHECTGEDCLVCLAVSRAQNLLSDGFGILFAALSTFVLFSILESEVFSSAVKTSRTTPVLLKDKLSD